MNSNRHPDVRAKRASKGDGPALATGPGRLLRGSGAGNGLRRSRLRMTGREWSAPTERVGCLPTIYFAAPAAFLVIVGSSRGAAQPSVGGFYKDKGVG